MENRFDELLAKEYLSKWQDILRLRDWDIKLMMVEKEWRKTADIKIDMTDQKAILMLNNYNPKETNLEAVVIHELLHLRLWGMDQLVEELLENLFGNDPNDPKYNFAFTKFMEILEPTVEDLAKGYLLLGADNKEISFGRVQKQVEEELS